LRYPSSKSGRDNSIEASSPHRVTAVGKLLTLKCLGSDWPSITFILALLSSDCGSSIVSNEEIFIYLLREAHLESG
jgi:hypothetical protein